MRKSVLFPFALLLFLLSATGCCRAFFSPEENFKKEMDCATRLTDDRSIAILKGGEFCCEALPGQVSGLPEARRFYLERAWGFAPDSPEAPLAIARSYWDEGKYRRALRFFDAARVRDPKPVSAVIGEVTMYRLLGDYEACSGWIAWLRRQKGIDAEKVAAYLTARVRYDQGDLDKAKPLFQLAVERADKTGTSLGGTPYTMKDAWFYLAQIALKEGDPQGAYQDFLLFLKKMGDPDFQLYYAYWLPRLGDHQAEFYAKIENDWVRVRQ